MIYAVKNKDDLKDLEGLDDLQSKVKQVRLVEKLGKQGYRYDIKELFEPITKSNKDASEEVTKNMTESSIKNNQALENINKKLLEIMNDRGI